MAKKLFMFAILFAAMLPRWCDAGEAASSHGRVHPFGGFDFKSGGYALVGEYQPEFSGALADKLGDFYTDDIALLERIGREWVTDGPAPFYACGADYSLYLLKAGKIVEHYSLNLQQGCNTIVFGQPSRHSYYFDPGKLAALAGKFKKPVIERKTFPTLEAGRAYFGTLAQRENFLMALEPDWVRYDGELHFVVACSPAELTDAGDERCERRVEREIRKRYPGEKFDLYPAATMIGLERSITFQMKCSKALRDAFNLYKMDRAWQDYAPDLLVFWKAPATGGAGNP